MGFEQPPQTPVVEEPPRKKPLKKGLAVLGMIGALQGAVTKEAHADTSTQDDTQAEKQGGGVEGMERAYAAADARWSGKGGIEKIDVRTEGAAPGGRVILYYGGKQEAGEKSAARYERGFTVIDPGNPSKSGDERWIDIRMTDFDDEGIKDRYDVNGKAGGLYNANPFGDEIRVRTDFPKDAAVAKRLGEKEREAVDAYWLYYAAKASGQDEGLTSDLNKRLQVAGAKFLDTFGETFYEKEHWTLWGDEEEPVRARLNGKVKEIKVFKPDMKGR